MRTIHRVLALGVLFSASVILFDTPAVHADHTGGPMQAMSIDMEEEATPANTSSALGTRETCRRINENNSLDADEDVTDGLRIDVTADGVPPYHDSGTPGDPSDDTGGLYSFAFTLNYSSANLTVDDLTLVPSMLGRNPGSSIVLISDPTPDDNADNQFNHSPFDSSSTEPEGGSGVLVRLTLVSETGAAAGAYPLTLTDNAHLDVSGAPYIPLVTNNAQVAVDAACEDFDGDGIPNAPDACPTYQGPPSNNGCPLPGPPAVGGTAGLIEQPSYSNGARISNVALIAGIAALFLLPGGLLVGRFAVRRSRR